VMKFRGKRMRLSEKNGIALLSLLNEISDRILFHLLLRQQHQ
jgi:hypothetical protein